MIDVNNLPASVRHNVQVFYASPSVNNWQQWMKPRGCVMVHILCIGAAGGGGAGLGGADNTARGGGGGGGSGAIASLLIPAIFVPDYLWVQPGLGGAGGIGGAGAGTPGGNGTHSIVSYTGPLAGGNPQARLVGTVFLQSGAGVSGGAGGVAGTATTATGGPTESAATTAVGAFCSWGLFAGVTGQGGAAGGSGAGNNVGANTVAMPRISPVAGPANGGAGGGSCAVTTSTSNNGGRSLYTSSYISEGQQGGQPAINGGTGPPGQYCLNPFMADGGCGGASIHDGVGGAGGPGAICSGGGGGGAGITGGNGGDGGDGLIIITCY